MRNQIQLRIAVLLSVCAIVFAISAPKMALAGDPIPTPDWTDFFGTSVTFNGQPAPVGSLIEAFDPQGVLCGKFIDTAVGKYGFMPVYGDDGWTTTVDEGAVQGDAITFTVNGRSASMLGPGDNVWVGKTDPKEMNLSATGALGFETFELPTDKFAGPFDTVHFRIGFRNLGDVTDFYKLSVTSNLGWDLIFPTDFIYVPTSSGDQFVTFSVVVPPFIIGNVSDQLTFSLISGLDSTNGVTGSVNVFVVVTDVDDDDGTALPTTFDLGQNYPNPFNPTTKIPFSIRARSEVTLSVYNVLGQKVDELSFGAMSAGEHVIEYNPSTKSSGVYFYKIVAGDFTATRRMILLK